MKLSISSPIALVLDPPRRFGRVTEVTVVAPIDHVREVATAEHAVLSGKRAHRATRVHRRHRAHGGKPAASA